MATGSHSEVQIDNEHFRVTKWTIKPGGHIPMHRHDYEYVVVPLVTMSMHVANADGTEFVTDLEEGLSYTRTAGQEHMIVNHNPDGIIEFVEIERLA